MWETIVPGWTDRAVFVGQTGSGKTTLAYRLLAAHRPYVVAVDPKRLLNWPWPIVGTLAELGAVDPRKMPRLIYRPSYEEISDPWALEGLWRWIYERGNTTCYVDETYLVTAGDQYPRFFGACLTQGREHGVEMWLATQRPMKIPQIVLSESEHAYLFRLRLRQDRVKMAEITGVEPEAIAALAKRVFLYARQDEAGVRGPYTMNLERMTA